MSAAESAWAPREPPVQLPPIAYSNTNGAPQLPLPTMHTRQPSPQPHNPFSTQSDPSAYLLKYNEQNPLGPPRHILRQTNEAPKFVSAPENRIYDFAFSDGNGHPYPVTPVPPRPRQGKKIGQRREVPRDDYFSRTSPRQESLSTRQIVQENHSIPPMRTASNEDAPSIPTNIRNEPLPQRQESPQSLYHTSASNNNTKSSELEHLPSYKEAQAESKMPPPTLKPDIPKNRTESLYVVLIRQQPAAARACGFGERDRRVLDPPPILEMKVNDPKATAEEISALLRYPHLVMHCSLLSAEDETDATTMDDPGDRRQQRRLMGTLVASPFVGKDEFDEEGCFFCFPDLSCRTTGKYRLRFSLVRLDPVKMRPGDKSPCMGPIITNVFQVFAAKDFPGMQSSTPLTRRLKEQGCLISVKKGIEKIGEKPTAAHARESSSDNEEDDADVSKKLKGKGKTKGPLKRPKK